MKKNNIFNSIPNKFDDEFVQLLIKNEAVTIERIVSKGHVSPATGWYKQTKDEWVIVLKGAAIIAFEDNSDVRLEAGDYIDIPAHTKHQVKWTDLEIETVWLAVHY